MKSLPSTPRRYRAVLVAALAVAATLAVAFAAPVAASPATAPSPSRAAAAYEKDRIVVLWTEDSRTQADIDKIQSTYNVQLDTQVPGVVDAWYFKILDSADPKTKAAQVARDPHVYWAGTTDDAIPTRTSRLLPFLFGAVVLVVIVVALMAFGPRRLRSWIPGSKPSDWELERLRERTERTQERLAEKAAKRTRSRT